MALLKFTNAPCKDCKERKIGCHGYCKAYIEYDKWQKWVRAERAKEKKWNGIKDREYYAELKRKGRMKEG